MTFLVIANVIDFAPRFAEEDVPSGSTFLSVVQERRRAPDAPDAGRGGGR